MRKQEQENPVLVGLKRIKNAMGERFPGGKRNFRNQDMMNIMNCILAFRGGFPLMIKRVVQTKGFGAARFLSFWP